MDYASLTLDLKQFTKMILYFSHFPTVESSSLIFNSKFQTKFGFSRQNVNNLRGGETFQTLKQQTV